MAIKNDGTLWGWGHNSYGQLGIANDTVYKNEPTIISEDTDWMKISCGEYHVVAIKSDYSMVSWGLNDYGQLGLNIYGDSIYAQLQPNNSYDWEYVSCGKNYSVAIKQDNTLWTWGYNSYGQLGTSNSNILRLPRQIMIGWSVITSGNEYTVAIHSDGTMWSWGSNANGRLGLSSNDNIYITTPSQIGTDHDWKFVVCYENHAIALKSNNSIWSWGYNGFGQLGLGDNVDKNIPTQIGIDNDWKKISVGHNTSAGIKLDGTLWTWGYNGHGQLSLGDYNSKDIPTKVFMNDEEKIYGWIDVVYGYYHMIALKMHGSIWACGSNIHGQLGFGDTTGRSLLEQLNVNGTDDEKYGWIKVSCGYYHTLALKRDSSMWSWGDNTDGQLGLGDTDNPIKDTTSGPFPFPFNYDLSQHNFISMETAYRNYSPSKIFGAGDNQYGWSAISSNNNYNIAVKDDGTMWSWGSGTNYQLGLGDATQVLIPTQIESDVDWNIPSCGSFHALVIKTNGEIWTIGSSSANSTSSDIPIKMGEYMNWSKIASGVYHSAIIKTDHTIWQWGNISTKTIPLQVGIENDWVDISCGYFFTIAIKNDGSLWGWGSNNSGQLGQEDTNIYDYPVVIDNNNYLKISCGFMHMVAIKDDYTLYGCGNNDNGQLNSSTLDNVLLITQIDNNLWNMVACGSYHTIAIKNDNTLWVCGYNEYGQLGLDSTDNVTTLTLINNDTNWLYVACGENHTVAIKNDNTLWSWGRNNYGQLGLNNQNNTLVPTKINDDIDWLLVSCGENHTVAIKQNGTIWAWGGNLYGQCGFDDTNTRLQPEQINSDTDWDYVVCGYYHTIAVKTNGTIYSWGTDNLAPRLSYNLQTLEFNAPCLHPNTMVMTTNGNKKLIDINSNDFVYDINNNPVKVLHLIKFGKTNKFILIKKDTFGINLPDNDLYITAGHPIVLNGVECFPNEMVNNDTISEVLLEKEINVYAIMTENRISIKNQNIDVLTWSESEFTEKFINKNGVYSKLYYKLL